MPIEPPAEMEQNSKTPSNAGLSSPTRTCKETGVKNAMKKKKKTDNREKETHTSCPLISHLLYRLRCDAM